MSKKKKKSESQSSAINTTQQIQQEQTAQGVADELSQPQSSSRQPLNYGRFVQKLQQNQGSSNNLSQNDPQRSQLLDSQRSMDVLQSKQNGSSTEVPLQQNSVPRDAGQLSQRGGKPGSNLKHVKLPSLNRLDMDQYQSLKSLIKQGCKELNAAGRLNMKYFRSSGNLESAEYFAANKQYEKAVGLYDQVMNQEPGNMKVVLGKSDCLRMKGDYDSAIEHYDYASSLDPPPKTQVRILFNKATALKCQQKLADAIEFYSQSSLLDPNNANTFFNKGLTQYQAGKIDEAIMSFSQTLKINPKDQEALLNKGSALREVGEFGQAVECFKQASEIKIKTAREYLNRGNALFQIDKLQESLNCFIKATELDDSLSEAHLNKGVVLFELGRTQEELQCYDKVLQTLPNDIKALYNRGLALREKGDIPGSLIAFNKVLEIDSSMIDALINKGIIYYVTGRYNESIKTYKEALILDKNSLIANINLGLCWRALNQSKRALNIYYDTLKVHPQSSEMHFSIGEIFRESLNLREALNSYAKAIEFNPIYSEAIFQKGICLLIANEIGPAASCFNLCLQFDPADPKHLIGKGQIFEIEGKIKAAIQKYDEAFKSIKKELDSDSAASLFKSHALSLKKGQLCKKSAVDSYLQLIFNQNEKHSSRQFAFKGICRIVVDEIITTSKQALLKGSGINSPMKLPGSEIDDVYFHLLCILASQIELMTTFTSSELKKIHEDYCSEQQQNLLFKYLTLKRKPGISNLSMEGGQHLIYMVLSFVYLALKKRENKEFEEAIIFFDFLMHLDKDLELFCRYHCFISFLQGSAFQASIKKFSIPLTNLVRKGKNMELYEISFDKEPLPSEDQKHNISGGSSSLQSSRQELGSQQLQQQQQQQAPLPSSCINRTFLERYEKELICKKIPVSIFKDKKDEFYSSFALQNILNHRNIQKINYLYMDAEENGYFIEPMQKQDLRQFLNQNIVPLEQRLNILIQLSNAVAYLHSNRIIHGSIESKNILLKETDNSVVLTNFTKSKPLIKSYHHQFTLDPSPIYHQQSFFSASQQISPTSFFAVETDIKIALSDDIKQLGELFQSLLLKIAQSDRIVNNWHRKGFSISAQLQKTILRMVDDKKTKRPDIQTVIESLQLEIITAILYSSLSTGVSMPPQNKLSSQGTNSKTNLLNTAQRSLFMNNPSNNLSALALHQQQILQQSAVMSDPISVQETDDPQSQLKKIEELNSPGIKGKTAKKNLQYFQFAQDIESIRDFYKMKILYQSPSASSQETQQQVNEKISNNLHFSYQYFEDLTNSELFLSALNKQNMIFLVVAIFGITDCGNYEQLQLLKRFNEAVEIQTKKNETENIFQFSQARLFYRVTNRSDPEKYRQKLLQKTHFKEFYMNISSIFLSDSIELIENKLRPVFIESLTKHAFQQVKRNLNGFTFASSQSIKKRKFLIFEQFVQVASQLNLPSSEIDKIAKDLIVHSKILNILKFEGYLQDLGEGVYDLLFNPLSEIIEKHFNFFKQDSCAISDLPQFTIIPAKQFYSSKIKYFKDLYKGIDLMKEQSVNYLKKSSIKRGSYVLDMKRSTLVSLEHQDSAKKPIQTPIQDSQRKSSVAISLQVPQSSSTNRLSQRLSQRLTGQQSDNDQEKISGSLKTTSNSLSNRDGKDDKQIQQSQQGISQQQHYKSNSSSQSPATQSPSLFQVASPYQTPPVLTLSQESTKIKQNSLNKLKDPAILFQEASFINYSTKNLTDIILEDTNTNFAQLKVLASEQKSNESTQKDTNAAGGDKKKAINQDKSQNNSSKTASAINSIANIQQESVISTSNLSVHGEESNRDTSKKNTGKNNSQSSAQGLNASSVQQQQESLIQAQNTALSLSQAMSDYIEEESYQQFIKNYLNNSLFSSDNNNNITNNNPQQGSSAQTILKQNTGITGNQNNHKFNSSLNHIPSEEEGDEDDEEQVKTTGKKTKEGSKQDTPVQTVKPSARDSQLIKTTEKKEIDEKNKPSKQTTKTNLNLEGVERKMSLVQGVAKIKAVKSVIGLGDSFNNSSIQNSQYEDYQELRANFAMQNGSLNEQRQMVISRILTIDFAELKDLFENLKKQQQQAEQ